MVAGRWQHARWHEPLQCEGGGTGAEVRAYIRGEDGAESVGSRVSGWSKADVMCSGRTRDKWTAVTNALAGLFCSSLGQISDAITSSPKDIFPPSTALPSSSSSCLLAPLLH